MKHCHFFIPQKTVVCPLILDTLLAHPAMQEWHEAALKETEAHAHYDDLAKEYGGVR